MSSDENGFIAVKGLSTILYIVISAAHYRHCSENVACVMRPPFFLFALPKRKNAPRPGLRVAAAWGRRRRHGSSAAAPLAGRCEAGPGKALRQGGTRKKRAPDADDISGVGALLSRITDIPVIRSERRWLSHASVRAQRCKCWNNRYKAGWKRRCLPRPRPE